MQITITHCRYAPNWHSLEHVIRDVTNEDAGRLIRISRRDGGCGYREPGVYDLGFRQSNDTVLPITLTVEK